MKKLSDAEYKVFWSKHQPTISQLADYSNQVSNVATKMATLAYEMERIDSNFTKKALPERGAQSSTRYSFRLPLMSERNLKANGVPTKSDLALYVNNAVQDLDKLNTSLSQNDSKAKSLGDKFYSLWEQYKQLSVRLKNYWNRIRSLVSSYSYQ